MAALVRQHQTVPHQGQPTYEDPHASTLKAMRTRVAQLEEELKDADAEKARAVAAAVAYTKQEAELARATIETTGIVSGREDELDRDVNMLKADLKSVRGNAIAERRRNALILQELARTLTATHVRTLAALDEHDSQHGESSCRHEGACFEKPTDT